MRPPDPGAGRLHGLGHPSLTTPWSAASRRPNRAGSHGHGVHSNHYGIAGYYAMMALPHTMIGPQPHQRCPLMAPTYGVHSRPGTNPIAVGAPANGERPYVLDMATTIVPLAASPFFRKPAWIFPVGWALDRTASQPRPEPVLDGGALMPSAART